MTRTRRVHPFPATFFALSLVVALCLASMLVLS